MSTSTATSAPLPRERRPAPAPAGLTMRAVHRGPLPMVQQECELCERPFCSTPVAAARDLNCPFCGHRLPRPTGATS